MVPYEIICDANHLYEAYLKTIKGSKWKETTQRFSLNYLRHIYKLQYELEHGLYKPSEEGEFTLSERGKIRPITTLQPRDRVVRHVLCDDVLYPKIYQKLIYDNGASIKKRGISFARKRFEAHLRKYYMANHTNEGYILFGDFRKFYDNIIHETAKKQLLKLFDDDPYLNWLLTVIFKNFEIDVSYMSDTEYDTCLGNVFDKLAYREIPNKFKTNEKYMAKSLNIGDQLSQIIGVFYPSRIDNYIKIVRGVKYYGRYMDDFYIIAKSKEELYDILDGIEIEAKKLGIHINKKKTRIVKLSSIYSYLQNKYSLTRTGRVIIRIGNKKIVRMRVKLKKLNVKYLNGEASYENIEEMFRSWMGEYYKHMSKIQRRNLLNLYCDLFSKKISFYKKNGKWKMIFSEVDDELFCKKDDNHLDKRRYL